MQLRKGGAGQRRSVAGKVDAVNGGPTRNLDEDSRLARLEIQTADDTAGAREEQAISVNITDHAFDVTVISVIMMFLFALFAVRFSLRGKDRRRRRKLVA